MNIYIVAHQDDWMLFRGEHSALHLQNPGERIVYIHTTAGDAGEQKGWWEARELATVMAVKQQVGNAPITISRPKINSHGLQRYQIRDAVLYFLRCNDGGKHGEGYKRSGYRSLKLLRDQGKALRTADKSTQYKDWNDFSITLERIVKRECKQQKSAISPSNCWIHCSDYAHSTNPGDHADHLATADAVRSFAAREGYGRVWFQTYCNRERAANITPEATEKKLKLFMSYGSELGRLLGMGTSGFNQEEWEWWGAKSYARLMQPGTIDNDQPSTTRNDFTNFITAS